MVAIVVICLGKEMVVELEDQITGVTVAELKEKIEETLLHENPAQMHVKNLRVYFNGKPLGEDSSLLSDYKIKPGSTIQTHADLMAVKNRRVDFDGKHLGEDSTLSSDDNTKPGSTIQTRATTSKRLCLHQPSEKKEEKEVKVDDVSLTFKVVKLLVPAALLLSFAFFLSAF